MNRGQVGSIRLAGVPGVVASVPVSISVSAPVASGALGGPAPSVAFPARGVFGSSGPGGRASLVSATATSAAGAGTVSTAAAAVGIASHGVTASGSLGVISRSTFLDVASVSGSGFLGSSFGAVLTSGTAPSGSGASGAASETILVGVAGATAGGAPASFSFFAGSTVVMSVSGVFASGDAGGVGGLLGVGQGAPGTTAGPGAIAEVVSSIAPGASAEGLVGEFVSPMIALVSAPVAAGAVGELDVVNGGVVVLSVSGVFAAGFPAVSGELIAVPAHATGSGCFPGAESGVAAVNVAALIDPFLATVDWWNMLPGAPVAISEMDPFTATSSGGPFAATTKATFTAKAVPSTWATGVTARPRRPILTNVAKFAKSTS